MSFKKNQIVAIFIIMAMMLLVYPLGAFAEIVKGADQTVTLKIGQQNYQKGINEVKTDIAPYIKDGRTMVPVAFVAPALGTDKAEWFPESRIVRVNRGNDVILITIGSKKLEVNNKVIMMDVAAEIKDIGGGGGRTMLPISFIAKALNVGYQWHGDTKTVEFYGYSETFAEKGTYGPTFNSETIAGNVTVTAGDVKLQNKIIKGNLIIAESVGDEDVYLNNITVEGNTYVRGGGKNSIHINGGSFQGNVVIENTPEGGTRVVVTNTEGVNVVVATGQQGEEVILEGSFGNVEITATDAVVSTQGQTTIENIVVNNIATVTVAEGTVVNTVELNVAATVTGEGTVSVANVNASGTIVETEGTSITTSEDADEPTTNTDSSPASTTGGGGGGDDSTPTIDSTPPLFTNSAPTAVTGDNDGQIKITGDLNESGKIYYVVVDVGGEPSVQQVKNGNNSYGDPNGDPNPHNYATEALVSGIINVVNPGNLITEVVSQYTITGRVGDTLDPGTYNVYFVAEDNAGTPNVQASVTSIAGVIVTGASEGNATGAFTSPTEGQTIADLNTFTGTSQDDNQVMGGAVAIKNNTLNKYWSVSANDYVDTRVEQCWIGSIIDTAGDGSYATWSLDVSSRTWEDGSYTAYLRVGDGQPHDDVATVNFTIQSAAPPAASIASTNPTMLSEAGANDGSLTSGTVVVTIANGEIAADIAKANVTAANLPGGMEYNVTRDSTTQLTIGITGNATNHANANDVNNLTFTIAQAKVTGATGDLTTGNISIDFNDPATSEGNATGAFTSPTEGQTIADLNTFTGTSQDDNQVMGGAVAIKNNTLNKYWSVSANDYVDTRVEQCWIGPFTDTAGDGSYTTWSLDVSSRAWEDGSYTAYLRVGDGQLHDDVATVNFTIQSVVPPAASVASTNPTMLSEAGANDGSLTSGTVVVTILNGEIAADIAKANVTAANLPGGMDYNVTRDSTTQLTIRITGNATNHANANDVNNLTFTIAQAKVTGATGDLTTGNISIDFNDPTAPAANIASTNPTILSEAGANDGSLTSGTVVVTIANGTLATDIAKANVTAANLPGGMDYTVTRNSDTQLTIGITGNATNHADANDVNNLTFTIAQAKVTGAIDDLTTGNISIDFIEPVQTGISGVVTSTVGGAAIAGVDVSIIGGNSTTTNGSGEYSISCANGSYFISLFADFYYHSQTPYQVSVPDTYNTVMQPAGKIIGTINLQGTLPPGSSIRAQISEYNNLDDAIVSGSDFTVRGVPVGTQTLSFELVGGGLQDYVYISPVPGDHNLTPGVTLNVGNAMNSTLSVPVTHPDGVSDDGIINIGTVKVIYDNQ